MSGPASETPPALSTVSNADSAADLFAGSSRRSNDAFTVAASKGVPSEKTTPWRMVNDQVRPASDDVHAVASRGRSWKSASSQIR